MGLVSLWAVGLVTVAVGLVSENL